MRVARAWELEGAAPRRWVDEATALRCEMRRGPMGAWNGYVEVPHGHPWHELRSSVVAGSVDVHGGVTYSERRDDGVWWMGFDCCHAGDIAPGIAAVVFEGDVYRDEAFVRGECRRLAAQIADARPPESRL